MAIIVKPAVPDTSFPPGTPLIYLVQTRCAVCPECNWINTLAAFDTLQRAKAFVLKENFQTKTWVEEVLFNPTT